MERTKPPSVQMSSPSDEKCAEKLNKLPQYKNLPPILVICCALACAVMTIQEWLTHLKNPLHQYFEATANTVRICAFNAGERFLSSSMLPVNSLRDRLKVCQKFLEPGKSQYYQVLRKCKFKKFTQFLKKEQPRTFTRQRRNFVPRQTFSKPRKGKKNSMFSTSLHSPALTTIFSPFLRQISSFFP